ILRVPEPEAGSTETATPVTLRARYPGGPRDAESLFAGPDGDLFVVTKGREGPVELFRYPSPHRPGETVTLEVIGQLLPRPSDSDDRVTAATTSPDGRWAAI